MEDFKWHLIHLKAILYARCTMKYWFNMRTVVFYSVLPIIIFFIGITISLSYGSASSELINNITHPINHKEYAEADIFPIYDVEISYSPWNDFTKELMNLTNDMLKVPSKQIIGFPTESQMLKYNIKNSNVTSFKIHFNYEEVNPKRVEVEIFVNKPRPADLFNPRGSEWYKKSNYLALLWGIQKSFIKMTTGTNVVLSILQFPDPPQIEVSTKYEYILPILFALSFFLTFLQLVSSLLEERLYGVNIFLNRNGVKKLTLRLSWILYMIIENLLPIIMIVVTIKFYSVNLMKHTNGFLLFAFLFLYFIANVTSLMVVSIFFKNYNWAVAVTMILWHVTLLLPKTLMLYMKVDFLSENLWTIIAGLFVPNFNFMRGFQIIYYYEGIQLGAQSSHLAITLTMFTVNLIIYIFLYIYFINVFPGKFGRSHPWCFPYSHLKRWCTKKSRDRVQEEEPAVQYVNGNSDNPHLKAPLIRTQNEDQPTTISIKNLSYKTATQETITVEDLSLKRGEVLNITGNKRKTKSDLIAIILGKKRPLEGEIRVFGQNVQDGLKMSTYSNIGLCFGVDSSYQKLSVKDQLVFFGLLRNKSVRTASDLAEDLLVKLNLIKFKNELQWSLPQYVKRTVQLACALIGNPEVIIIDNLFLDINFGERGNIRKILFEEKWSKTIIMTSDYVRTQKTYCEKIGYFMKEYFICMETDEYLKTNDLDNRLEAFVSIESDTNLELSKKKIERMLENIIVAEGEPKSEETNGKWRILFALDKEKKDLYGKVFAKVEPEYSLSVRKRRQIVMDAPTVAVPIPTIRDSAVPFHFSKLLRNLGSIFLKRKFLFISYLFIIFLMSFIFYFTNKKITSNNIDLNLFAYKGNTVLYGARNNPDDVFQVLDNYRKAVEMESGNLEVVENGESISQVIIDRGTKDLLFYKQQMVMAAEFDTNTSACAMFSREATHGMPISLNLVMNVIHQLLRNSSYRMSFRNLADLSVLQDESHNFFHSPGLMIFLFLLCVLLLITFSISMDYPVHIKQQIYMSGVSSQMYWASIFSFDFIMNYLVAIIFLTLVSLYAEESRSVHELGALVVILLAYAFINVPFIAIFARKTVRFAGISWYLIIGLVGGVLGVVSALLSSQESHWRNLGAILWTFLRAIPQFGLMDTMIRFLKKVEWNFEWNQFSEERKQQNCNHDYNPCCNSKEECEDFQSYFFGHVHILTHVIIVIICGFIYTAIVICSDNHFKPKYKFHKKLRSLRSCIIISYDPQQEGFTNLKKFTFKLASDIEKEFNYKLEIPITKNNLLIYVLKSAPNGFSNFVEAYPGVKEVVLRSDLSMKEILSINKMEDVQPLPTTSSFSGISVLNISGSNAALKNVSFQIEKGKCFGLVGSNNSDRSAILKLISGYEPLKSGSVTLVNMPPNSLIGYCPHYEEISDNITGKEFLSLFARLRGARSGDVYSWIESLELQDSANKVFKMCGYTNQRMWQFAASVIGSPEIVVLDNPMVGVNYRCRLKMKGVIDSLRAANNCTIVISSNEIHEIESLCDRIAFVENGTLLFEEDKAVLLKRCRKSITVSLLFKETCNDKHTKEKNISCAKVKMADWMHSMGYRVTFIMFEGLDLLKYKIYDNKKKWSEIYEGLVKLKSQLDQSRIYLDHFQARETTLEEIYLAMTKERDVKRKLEILEIFRA